MNYKQWSSKQAIQNYQLVSKIARVIGLADHAPIKQAHSAYIDNSPHKKTRIRKFNQSDIIPLERQLQSQRKRTNSVSKQSQKVTESRSSRKGAIIDIFINKIKPEEDPLICARTKKIILKSDIARARKQALERAYIQKLALNKSQRSKILNQLSRQMPVEIKPVIIQSRAENWFDEYRFAKPSKRKSYSQEKLVQSLDFSKFCLIARKNGLLLKSRECKSELRTQTAPGKRRLVNLKFNGNDKAEIVYPNFESRAQL